MYLELIIITLIYSADGGTTWDTVTTTNTSVALTGLTSGVTYSWSVMSSCQSDDSNNSAWVAANFSTLNPCDDPAGLSTSNILIDRATLNWSAVTGANHYNLRFREVGLGAWLTLSNLTSTSRTVYNLSSNTDYEWEVQSSCDASNSNVSAWVAATFTTVGCVTPSNLSATNVATDRATLNWDAVSGSNHYNVRFRLQGSSTWATTINYVSSTSRTIYSLSTGTSYEFQVQNSCNSANSDLSPWSSTEIFTTSAGCVNPSSFSAINVTSTTSTLTWTAVSSVSYYRIRHAVAGGSWGSGTFTNTTNISLDITGLSPNTNYEWHIITVCPGGQNAGWTSRVYYTTSASGSRLTALDNIEELNIYPNPNSGLFKLQFKSNYTQDIFIKIFDELGKNIYKNTISNFKGNYINDVNILGLKPGVYYIQLVAENQISSQKIVIK